MKNLVQERAELAFRHVSAVSQDKSVDARKYATIVHKLPALIASAGACQSLHFVDSRGDASQRQILSHLAEQLTRVSPEITTPATLLRVARESDLATTLHLTVELSACAAWYRRMVQGVLRIEADDAAD